MRRLGKRGDVDVQFNWVFVFIVGALILAIAVGFVTTQKKNSDTIISNQIMRYTRSVITHSLSTSEKIRFLPLQKSLGASCSLADCSSSGCVSELYVLPKSLKASVTYIEPIFSPTTIGGKQMMTWTAEFSLPYHAINLIYLTSDTARYILVGDDSLADELYLGLPESMKNKERITASQLASLKDKNNDKIKLVFFGIEPTLPPALKGMPDSDLGAIKVIPTDGSSQGSIQFYRKKGSLLQEEDGPVPYLGKPLLYGAIFSENLESYACNLRKCLTRLGVVSQSYRQKLALLKDSSVVGAACRPYYEEAFALVSSEALQKPSFDNLLDIPALASQIMSRNNALKTKSCPVIY
jgi:hypothetical protein